MITVTEKYYDILLLLFSGQFVTNILSMPANNVLSFFLFFMAYYGSKMTYSSQCDNKWIINW